MKKFIVNLFSNRFGILLAVLNLCYFVNKTPVLFNFPRTFFGKLFLSLNAPALICAGISARISEEFLNVLSFESRYKLISVFIAFFIVLQWLFIAWFARTIAQKFRPKEI
jgi:hypothetical protein